jgi:hypothetical protein
MYRPALWRQALGLGLLVTLVVLALSACGGGGGSGGSDSEQAKQEQPKIHAITQPGKPLTPGKYATKVFEPSMSFSVGEGWISMLPETHDAVALGEENGPTLIGILNLEKVFDPNDPSEANPEPADVGAWLQEHPRLDVEQPSRVTVGGVSGQQFDAVASEPKEGPEFCSEACVPLFYITNNNFWVGKTEKYRFMVLDNVEGQTVTIFFGGPAVEFEESLPKAQEVLETVDWEGA